MSEHTVGTCGNCGGPVRAPLVWHGVVPPTPRCAHCGATVAQNGPVLPMNPPPANAFTICHTPHRIEHTAVLG